MEKNNVGRERQRQSCCRDGGLIRLVCVYVGIIVLLSYCLIVLIVCTYNVQ